MNLDKTKVIFGIIFIVSGLMFFYHFFNIMISSLFKDDATFIDIFPGMITHVLPEMWHFHIPGFVLIGVGIFYLWKSKRLKTKINQNNNS